MTIDRPGADQAEPPALAHIIDTSRWSAGQKLSALLAGLAVVIDGFDNQILALAVPAIAREWQVGPASFAPALSAGLAGIMIGNACGGAIGDRLGRRVTLIVSLILFGLLTASIALAPGVPLLALCRLIAGLGLGSAVPNASALVGELTPQRRRTVAVTLATLCIPIGAVIAGLAAGLLLPAGGWKLLFVVGGGAAILVAAVSAVLLDESPYFLAARPGRSAKLASFLERLDAPMPATAAPGEQAAAGSTRGAFATVLAGPWRRDTLFLWLASLGNMLGLYAILSWLPSLLGKAGYTLAQSSFSTSAFNLGGIAGALGGAWCVDRYGSRVTLATMAFASAMLGLVLAVPALGPAMPFSVLLVILTALGAAAGGLNVLLFPLALNLYPATARAGGLGLNLSIGRIGAVAAPFLAIAATASGGTHAFFGAYAVALGIAAIAILQIRTHLDARPRNGTANSSRE